MVISAKFRATLGIEGVGEIKLNWEENEYGEYLALGGELRVVQATDGKWLWVSEIPRWKVSGAGKDYTWETTVLDAERSFGQWLVRQETT